MGHAQGLHGRAQAHERRGLDQLLQL
jgi:hypothetical protein